MVVNNYTIYVISGQSILYKKQTPSVTDSSVSEDNMFLTGKHSLESYMKIIVVNSHSTRNYT